MLVHNMNGMPVFGTGLCGHLRHLATGISELCVRWTALGAFFPVLLNVPVKSGSKVSGHLVVTNCGFTTFSQLTNYIDKSKLIRFCSTFDALRMGGDFPSMLCSFSN